ncbi:Glutamate 5-kinase [Rhodanobacter lindaniclasticus]
MLPVINENDTVSVDELKLGDNDNLAAIVAALVDADLLLIASDVDALYSADPRRDPAAVPIAQVAALTPEIVAMAGDSGSAAGTGGMRTKLQAAAKAAAAGIPTALFSGREAATVQALQRGQLRGTLIAAASTRLQARKYWLRHAPAAPGRIRVDAGAAKAWLRAAASRCCRAACSAPTASSIAAIWWRSSTRKAPPSRADSASTALPRCAGWPAGTAARSTACSVTPMATRWCIATTSSSR